MLVPWHTPAPDVASAMTYGGPPPLPTTSAVRHSEVIALLCNNDIEVRRRRRPDVWSPLEYGCHLRDVLLV